MKKYFNTENNIANVAIFLSGSGTNAENLLKELKNSNDNWNPVAIVTDAPETSRAAELAEKFNVKLIALDIRKFYNERGEKRISILTKKGQEIREEWTNELRTLLKPLNIDFGVLAGFVPLSNITDDFPCLNVHPGDLTVLENGKRLLVGLHTVPVEIAIVAGLTEMRSSVIIAQAYTGKGGEMDSGPILGISQSVRIDLQGNSLDDLKTIANQRPEKRPVGGYKDKLEEVASFNQELLKVDGDWVVFPKVVAEFAKGNYTEENNQLYYKNEEIKTISFSPKTFEVIK